MVRSGECPRNIAACICQRYHKAPHHQGRWGLWCGSPHPFCMWSGSRSWEPKLCNKVLNSHPRFCLQSTPPACLQAAPSPPLTGKPSSGYALPAQAWSVRATLGGGGWGVRWSWRRPSTKPHAQGPKGNPATCALLQRESCDFRPLGTVPNSLTS